MVLLKKEALPTEYQYEFEQEMLKHVHEFKKDLRDKGWWECDISKVSQTTFLSNEILPNIQKSNIYSTANV